MPAKNMFKVCTETYFGIGISRNLADILREKGFNNVSVLVDEGVYKNSGYYKEIFEVLENGANIVSVEVLRGDQEPDYDYLDQVSDRARSGRRPDALIGIGGGSTLDITKATAVLLTNPGNGITYRGFDRVQTAGLPTIAIPTTAGSGSEVTFNAVFTDKREMVKLGINGRYMNATCSILDSEWTMSCPFSAAVSSGMDALVHALESFMCVYATPLSRSVSREAFKTLYESLPSLADDPDNREKRQNLLYGAYLAGMALFNSGSGIAGAFSYPLGVHYGIPHGIAGGIFIGSVLQYNVERGYEEYAELIDLIEMRSDLNIREKNFRFVKLINDLQEKLKVPSVLTSWGITENQIQEIESSMLTLQAAFDQNPIPFSAENDASLLLSRHTEKELQG